MVTVKHIDESSILAESLKPLIQYSTPREGVIPFELNHSIGHEKTSEEKLASIIIDDIPIAKDQFKLPAQLSQKHRRHIVKVIGELYPKHSVTVSGEFLYTDGCFMGWHTNSNVPSKRIYLTYVPESTKSFFRYMHEDKIHTSYDEKGWTLRELDISEDDLLWHCVMSKTNRLSIGFRVVKNLKS